MAPAHEQIIEEARRAHPYRCARCDYLLGGVPMDADRVVVCPECGYEMVFGIKVQLLPRDPEYDRETRTALEQFERAVLPVSIVLMAMLLGLAVLVYMLVF